MNQQMRAIKSTAAKLIGAGGLALALLASPPGAAAATVTEELDQPRAEVLDYWTPERMREALPREALPGPSPAGPVPSAAATEPAGTPQTFAGLPPTGGSASAAAEPADHTAYARAPVADPTAYPFSTHGKVFARIRGIGPYVCSGTVVTSNNQSVVITAAHCVHAILFTRSGRLVRRFASDFLFVPAYDRGAEPYGRWVARRLSVPRAWQAWEPITLDVASAQMRLSNGRRIGATVGSRGIGFNLRRNQDPVRAYGYPAAAKFDDRMQECDSTFAGNDGSTRFLPGPATMRIGCDVTGGASGGGWVVREGSPGCGAAGCQYSLVSYGYADEPEHLYGPLFAGDARRVWINAQRNCRGSLPTQTGTTGDDVIAGTRGRDVIISMGGDDRINGRGGNDKICTGRGDDVLYGSQGSDRLLSGAGADRLVGGPGRDLCNGGGGTDVGRGCERRPRIP